MFKNTSAASSPVVVLYHSAHGEDGPLVVVRGCWADVVQGGWIARVTVGASEINGNLMRNNRNKVEIKPTTYYLLIYHKQHLDNI